MKKKTKLIFVLIIILAVVADLFFLLYPVIRGAIDTQSQSHVMSKYIDEVTSMNNADMQKQLEAAREYNKALLTKPDRFNFSETEMADYNQLLNTGDGVMGMPRSSRIPAAIYRFERTIRRGEKADG